LFISETASGKSLTYIMSAMVLKGFSMVISPLVSLMLDQLEHLPLELTGACISSLISKENQRSIAEQVKKGNINILFLTPEALQTDFLYHLQDFPEANFVCVDEAHSLSELSHNFRTSFLMLSDVILHMVRYRSRRPTVLGLTATANPETVASVVEKL
jgi:ATP-dependent DNA helicase Q4